MYLDTGWTSHTGVMYLKTVYVWEIVQCFIISMKSYCSKLQRDLKQMLINIISKRTARKIKLDS